MKKLKWLNPDPTYVSRFISIRGSKHLATRQSLFAVHAFIALQFASYVDRAVAGALSGMQPSPECGLAADHLRACYGSPTIPLVNLKNDIKAAQSPRQLKICPMCGISLPETFDHYLPMRHFPEFSVFAMNLVPCCASCNSLKGDDWLDAGGHRQYLYAFSDDIPEVAFFTADLIEAPGVSGVGVAFGITRPPGVPAGLWGIVESHCERLRLVKRYDELGNAEIAEILADCRIYSDTGAGDVRRFLANRALERGRTHGRSYWRAVLMKAIAAHPRLPDWVSETMADV